MAERQMTIEQLGRILRENGVVGAGGAGFPSYGKLSDKADLLLLNCAECEPLLKLHRQLLAEHAAEILQAFDLVARTLGVSEAVLGIKAAYRQTLSAVRAHIGAYPGMRIHELPQAYPMGDEVVLIYEATGRVVRPGGLPIEQGVVVFNVETMYNIYRAVFLNHPVTDKYITVAGEVAHPCTLRVPIGMPLREVVALAGGETTPDPVYLLGGPMMGSFGSVDSVVTKTSSAVIVLPADHSLVYRKKPNISHAINRAAASCCQCRTCTDLCPRHALGHPIEPHLFMRAAANRDVQDVSPFINTWFCCSCGLCELYSCPQGLSPRSIMAAYKNGLREAGVKAPRVEARPVEIQRDYRRTPEERLTSRLGLLEYDRPAPLTDELQAAKRLTVQMRQHIGAPASPAVSIGERVEAGQVIGAAADGLSVCIHAPAAGTVTAVSGAAVEITIG